MTQYELMVIIDQNAGEKAIEATLDSLRTLVKNHDGKITKEDIWGTKTLAYKIHGSTQGYYALFNLELDGKELKELTKELNLVKPIWRNMFVKLEK